MGRILGICIALLGAAAPAAQPGYRSVQIENVPHVRQRPDFCGEACAEMALRKLGHRHTQDDVFAATGVDPALGRGAVTQELVHGLKQIGFDVGPVWYTVRPVRSAVELEAQFKALHADLARGTPSIVCTRYDGSAGSSEHFRLVLGYDARTDEVVYHEPALARAAHRRMARQQLLKLWPLKYSTRRWTVVRIRLKPGTIRPPSVQGRPPHTPAGYAQHVLALRQKIRDRRLRGRFTVVIQPPFVVVGDEAPGVVRRRARSTVKWAVDLLKKDYFARDPNRILDIWLFKGRRSYADSTVKLSGQRPGTPFGFYSEELDALIMNISTGGGTLVHEIVHPFVEANFPDAPPWFNEGLGSLYEACGERQGKIWGYTNWRLPGLQQAIRRKAVPSFKWLTSRTTVQFYQRDPGTNYGQSRYLLYYLQEKGLLRRYYRSFLDRRRKDPTGYETLKQVLGVADMEAFKRDWEAYVASLRWVR